MMGNRKGRKLKQIDEKKFYEALNAFVNGEMSLRKCEQYLGITHDTIKKWFNMVLLGEKLPKGLFLGTEKGFGSDFD